ncbi:hypothetical protein ACFLFF_26990 [Brevibacillus reuszeri]|uniref:hypothetical protein n=1 Tax=Brevibacillus reuszeri TaxID=54915 RepID=UPI00366F49DA
MAVSGKSAHAVMTNAVNTILQATASTKINSILLHNRDSSTRKLTIYIVKAGMVNGVNYQFYDFNLPAGGSASINDPIHLSINDRINARADALDAVNVLINYTEVT